ncbi:MAG: UDP-N-acetylmuramate--L-alanine ligase [Candidatus Levybacteria bacterium]|nr:UDP-N-acetylmuramate--L-alanine ligase [Candidatus Levybacteria bacterium]
MKINKPYKHIHFIGIKGVGMAPLAILAKEAGFTVTGCDIPEEFITDDALRKSAIVPLNYFSKDHLIGVDLVITTGAHGGFDNPEVGEAKQEKIQVLTQGEAVGYFMSGEPISRTDIQGISVAGTHGKTTTTAMIATLLSNIDASYVVGTSALIPLGLPGHYGKGSYFVAEADEYVTEPTYDKTAKFLWQHPKFIVITNIEYDHPDVYSSIDDVMVAFVKFVRQLPKDGILVACGDDHQVRNLLKQYSGKTITYGFSSNNDYVIKRVNISGHQTFFWLTGLGGADLGEFVLRVSGEHNALNAAASIVVALECGLPIEVIRRTMHAFGGVKRRFEFLGTLPNGALLYDDYAHHPTEIKKTLSTFKKRFLNKKIVCIFQPHTYSRTKKLFEDFCRSFIDADTVVVVNIYSSLREKPDDSVSSLRLAQAISSRHRNVHFLETTHDVVEYITKKQFGEETVVVLMGAGDIYKVGAHVSLKASE